MDIDQEVIDRCQRLIDKGVSMHDLNGSYTEWRAQSLTFLRSVLGDCDYTTSFASVVPQVWDVYVVERGLGVLRAVKEDLENGYFESIRSLIAGEVFSDFLEMAQHLAEQGLAPPAVALAGAVLEDGLRRLCTRTEIKFNPRTDGIKNLLDKLLAVEQVVVLEVTSLKYLADLRNKVDHGNFNQIEGLDGPYALRVVDEVRTFLAKHAA